ncbi:hypothetical protein ACUHMQ_21220, partial [Chitinimonas sp. PSY-7]|uniref:hypothetical protein n=1 Tax=Chitinimonas sp. PSY-7 TaxID=3459088 RepID=UPI004040023D
CLLKHGDDLAVRKSRFLHFVELPLSEKILLLHTPIFRGDYRRIAKIRARVEHPFASLAQMGGKALRW